MFPIFLVISLTFLIFIGMCMAKILGFDIRLWKIFVYPPLFMVIGTGIALLPVILLAVCLAWSK